MHLGLPKTGSSSIQAFLRSHAAELLERGVRFPVPESEAGRRISENRIPHFDLIHHFYRLVHPPAARAINYNQVLAQSRRDDPGSILLLTHEAQVLHGHNARKERFQELSATHDVDFICYVRNPVSWLASFYEQAVSQPNRFLADPAGHFATRAYLSKGFRGMIEPFRDVGSVELFDYDALRSGGQLVPGFLRRVGAGAMVEQACAAPRVNAHAYSPEQIGLMRQLKSQGVDASLFVRVRDYFDQFNAVSPRERAPVVLFPAELRVSIERQWVQDLDTLSAELPLTGVSPEVDPAPYRDDPAAFEAMTMFFAAVDDAQAAAAVHKAIRASHRAAA